ncbi:peroxide stress protein YaaA [Nocardioidaceae bacterium SCSIO 66511]|nr:peroxide stress protein YaaA [Nocardioidaceae bacterium SCSIO 66511]
MLVLLPPSEGKTVPVRGNPLDLKRLALPELTPARERVLDALVELCESDPEAAATALDLGPTQSDAIARNAVLPSLPTARADRIYTGVLYEALDLATLDASAKRRATSRLAIASGLFGLVRTGDRIPAYRLSGDVTLPGLGPVAAVWRDALAEVVPQLVGSGLLIDLRSQTYASYFRPKGRLADRTATVRVIHEHAGVRKIVSHFNKATKGRIVRALLDSGANPRTVTALADTLRDLGWTIERDGGRLDVIVAEV